MLQLLAAAVLLLATLLISISFGRRLGLSAGLCFILFAWHTAATVAYFQFSEAENADARMYYERALEGAPDFMPGTNTVILVTRFFAHFMGLNVFNTFLVFGLMGLLGLLLLVANLNACAFRLENRRSLLPYVVAFLPGLSFWSSMIGKDAPAFFAINLMIYASLVPARRAIALVTAIAILFCIRPHIAMAAVVAALLGFLLAAGVPTALRLRILFVLVIIAALMVPLVVQYIGLSTDLQFGDLSDYVDARQDANQGQSTSVALQDMSPPMIAFSYLFRPMPFEVPGALGAIAGLENLVLLMIVTFVTLPRLWKILTDGLFATRFNLIFFVLSLTILAATTANLGIAVRQKIMLLPSLIALTVLGARSPKTAESADQQLPGAAREFTA
jgi:hypothetical protein